MKGYRLGRVSDDGIYVERIHDAGWSEWVSNGRRCNWNCSGMHVASNAGTLGDEHGQYGYCTHERTKHMHGPLPDFCMDSREGIHVEWGQVCASEPPPALTLF